jgi:Tol biopolymer transport system component/DNA-binding winged helix-turn-helix (wHTH) protein
MNPAYSPRPRVVFRFGPFTLDPEAKVLLRDGRSVRLTRKAVETLLVLVENSGRVVTKAELMAAVWPDRVVEEANLVQNIAVVRRALAVEQGQPGHIETFPGRGYRLVGPVEAVEEEPALELPPAPSRARRLRRLSWALPAAAFLAAVVWLALSWWPGAGLPEFRRIPVTRLAGKEFHPAISPDGTAVAFVWEQEPEQPAQIWVISSSEASPRQVSRTPNRHVSPAWSPDGRALAFLRLTDAGGEVVIASVSGGVERNLGGGLPTRFGLAHRHLDWSPDGQRLAVDDAPSPGEPLGIFLISVATGERQRLTRVEPPFIGDVDPRFSPDGRRLAFVRIFHRARQELFVVPADGGPPRQLTFDGRQISGHDWTADGKWLVFGSDRDGSFKLWRLHPEAPHPAETVAFAGIYADYPIQLSIGRAAEALVYSVLPQDLNIWRLDLGLARQGRPGWTRVIASPVMDASPQYSPAGDRIVFRSDRSGEEQLWVASADGADPVQVTRGRLRPSVGRWAPGGRSIVFNDSQDTRLYLAIEEEGGRWRTRDLGATGLHPIFSPDGTAIFAGGETGIVRIPAAGGAAERLTEFSARSLGASRDGRLIYFVREPAGTSLWALDTENRQVSKVLDGLVPYCSSCWAVAADGIYYLGSPANLPDRQAIFFLDFATGRTRLLIEYPEPLPPIGAGPFSLSPDGRYLLAVRAEPANSDIVRVEPFR